MFALLQQELLADLLALFEKRDHYSSKELQNLTDQPMPYLKSTLREVARFVPDGPNARKWELLDSHKLKE